MSFKDLLQSQQGEVNGLMKYLDELFRSKCFGCIFLDFESVENDAVRVCIRPDDLDKGIAACKEPGPCKWHITYEDVINIQEATNDQM